MIEKRIALELSQIRDYPPSDVEAYDLYPEFASLKKHYDRMLLALDLDSDNYNKSSWNPFVEFINKGCKVLVKPNLVHHHAPGGRLLPVVTNQAILMITLDYVFKALDNTGHVIVGDSSMQSADFVELIRKTGLERLRDYYKKKGMYFAIKDLRREAVIKDDYGHVYGRTQVNDVNQFIKVDLGAHSFFDSVRHKYCRFRVTDYDYSLMRKAQNRRNHIYLLHKDAMNADVIINVPKLKTHRKAGFSGAMKNLIGICGSKDGLPHHMAGSKRRGGDEYLYANCLRMLSGKIMDQCYRLSYWQGHTAMNNLLQDCASRICRILGNLAQRFGKRDDFEEGSWYGNDTIWRTICDVNRIAYFCDKDGQLSNKQQRVIFTVVDGIVSGDGEGPVAPRERPIGLLGAGFSTHLVDSALTAILGFVWERIPFLCASKQYEMNGEDASRVSGDVHSCEILLNGEKIAYSDLLKECCMHFEPPSGWKGFVESQ
jgi:uncharacterized protein (DUF362 family)